MDDHDLVDRSRRDPAAFGELFDRYHDRIYAFVYRRTGHRQDAEDLTAAVFEQAFGGVRRFRWQGKPFAAWLYTVASRRLADYYRRERSGRLDGRPPTRRHGSGGRGTAEDLADPRDPIARAEDAVALRVAIGRLSAADQAVVDLTYFAGLDAGEAASALGCSRAQVHVRLHRALGRLRRQLEEDGHAS